MLEREAWRRSIVAEAVSSAPKSTEQSVTTDSRDDLPQDSSNTDEEVPTSPEVHVDPRLRHL